ncbi:MAG: efflux RND transporter periplasmic adaptor subunit [Chitinispirillaceae bacterium]|nr:efflux RND transporter periplasmic adaptor subunit [Chitinispirillaceae bacterium]
MNKWMRGKKTNNTVARRSVFHGEALLAGIIACVVVFGCSKKDKTVSESISDIQKREGIPVTVITAEAGDLAAIERCGGTVEGYRQTVLTASIPAKVASIPVAVGRKVAADALLMKLDPYTPSSLAIAKAAAESVKKSKERVQTLAEQGGVPQEALDNLETGIVTAQENLEAARKAEEIHAPFAGTIVEIYPEVNTVVSPGTKLVKISSLSRVRVDAEVSEAVISRFARGQTAIAVIRGNTVKGKVENVSLAADESSHSFTVETVFENAGAKLRPGMYLSLDVIVETRSNVLALPMETIITEGSSKYVYVVKGTAASKRTVTTGIRGGDLLEIIEGVSVGEKVVSSGASLLSDGARVKVVE